MTSAKPPYSIRTVRFPSVHGQCAADVYQPAGDGPFPVIVMAHGLGGTRNMRLPAFAGRFAAAGYACLLFDYRHFGDSDGEPRQLLDIRRQLEDWRAGIAFARRQSFADPRRIVLWGTSFGGGHVLTTAAADHQVAAVISQCPFTDGLSSSLAVSPLVSLRLTALAVIDRIGALFGACPRMVAVAGLPGETALMTAADAYSGYLKLIPPGVTSHNYAPARFALDIVRYFPGRKARRIQAPVLYCVCNNDTVAPSGPTLRYATQTPRKEVLRYDYGHFDIYVGSAFDEVVGDQLDFLQRTVPAAAGKGA